MLTLGEVLNDFRLYAGWPDGAAVDVASRSEAGETPLHWMAILGDNKEIDLLVRAGCDLNAADRDGNTALHAAVSVRHSTAVTALLKAGADVGKRNNADQTPLDAAKLDGYRWTIELLEAKPR
jgi:ankyrin repeat protein